MLTLGIIFLLQVAIRVALGFDTGRYHTLIHQYLAFSPSAVLSKGYVWQIFTYFWISSLDSIVPILFHLLGIYLFVPLLEFQIGRVRTLVAFISAGVAGALLPLLLSLILLKPAGLYGLEFVGANAAITGLFAAYLWWYRDRHIRLILIEAKGWQLLAGLTAFVILSALLTPTPLYVIHSLGGIGMGMAVGSGKDPYALFQHFRLWRLRRKVRVIRGGKDDRDWMN